MAQESELNGTIPTGRQTPLSDHSSVSATSVLSPMRRRKPSHATIRHPRRRTKPFKLSLNLTVKVQPMNNGRKQRFSLNKSFGPDDEISDIKSSDSRSSHDSSKDKKRTSGDRRNESGFDSLLNKSRHSETSFDDDLPCRLNFDESLVEPREIDAVEAKSSDSRSSHASPRSSQGSLKNKKKKVQTTGNCRYKNKRSLLSFASLRKPRSKSLGTSVRFHDDLPHRFSSNGSNSLDEVLGAESSDSSHASSRSSQRSLRDKRKVQTTGNHRYKNKRSSLKKPRSKSLTKIPGFVPYPRPKRLSFNDSTAVPDDEVNGNESMKSDADKTFPLDRSFPNSLGLDDSLPLPRRLSFNDSVATAVAPVEMSTVGSETPKIYYHQRLFRVGFIGNNGVQMAFNCVVNIRSDQEVLYVKPCELLFEGEKVWSRSVRQVTDEIQAKLAADKKNQM